LRGMLCVSTQILSAAAVTAVRVTSQCCMQGCLD
jgi:hypothetical protein